MGTTLSQLISSWASAYPQQAPSTPASGATPLAQPTPIPTAPATPPPVQGLVFTPPAPTATPVSLPSQTPPARPYANIPTPGTTTAVPIPTYPMDPSGRNNPGNIRGPNGAFASYPTPQAGIAAMNDNLIAYQDDHGIDTLGGVIARWSPPNENNTPQLIADAASRTGFGPDQKIDLHDPAVRQKVVSAIVAQEQSGKGTQLPRQQYLPSTENRPPHQWGTTPYGGYGNGPGEMPRWYDWPAMMQRSAAMMPLLSAFVAFAGVPMLTAFASAVKGYQSGQLLQQQLSKGQMQEQLKETTARLEQEQMEAGDAFSAYGDNEPELDRALSQIAAKYGDHTMQAALTNGGAAAVYKLQQGRDRYFTDLNKTRLAQEKMVLEEQRMTLQFENQNLENQIRTRQLEIETETEPAKIAKAKADLQELQQKLQKNQDAQKENQRRQQEWYGGSGGPVTGAPDSSVPPEQTGGDSGGDSSTPPESTPTTPTEPAAPAPQAPAATPPASVGAPGKAAPAAPAGPQQYTPGYDPNTGTTTSPAAPPATAPAASPQKSAAAAPPPAAQPAGVQEATLESDLPDPAVAKLAEAQAAPAQPQAPPQTAALSGDALAQRIQQNEAHEVPVYQYARTLLHGGEPMSGTEMAPFNADAERLVVGLQARLQGLANSGLTGQALIDAVRRVDNGAANALQRVYTNTGPVPGASQRGTISPRMQAYGQTIASLATQAAPPDLATGDPGWRPGQYDLLQKFSDRNSYAQRTLSRANTMGEAAQNVILDLRELKGMGVSPSRIQTAIDNFNQTHLIGDSRYTNLITDLQSFTQEDQALRSGTAGVTETERQIQTVAPNLFVGTPDQIRGYIQHNVDTAAARIRDNQNWWHQNHGPGAMVGANPEVMNVIAALPYLNTKTGRFENLPKGFTLPDKLKRSEPAETKGFNPDDY